MSCEEGNTMFPRSALAFESALGSGPTVALSFAQVEVVVRPAQPRTRFIVAQTTERSPKVRQSFGNIFR
jgi:hypothetical protein